MKELIYVLFAVTVGFTSGALGFSAGLAKAQKEYVAGQVSGCNLALRGVGVPSEVQCIAKDGKTYVFIPGQDLFPLDQ